MKTEIDREKTRGEREKRRERKEGRKGGKEENLRKTNYVNVVFF